MVTDWQFYFSVQYHQFLSSSSKMNHGPKTNEEEECESNPKKKTLTNSKRSCQPRFQKKGQLAHGCLRTWRVLVSSIFYRRNFDSARSLQPLIQPLELCHYDTISFQWVYKPITHHTCTWFGAHLGDPT